MNYLNDFGQSGVDETKRLRLIWPRSERVMLRLDHRQPRWTGMLQDGQITCCFAVAVYECLVYQGDVARVCEHSEVSQHQRSQKTLSKSPLLSTSFSLCEGPTVTLPLEPLGTMKLDSGRLTLVSEHQDGRAQLAVFWVPDYLDKANEALNASSLRRLGPRTHAEFLDASKDTGLSIGVCIMDR